MLNTSNDQRKLLSNFEHLFATTAQAPGGVARLRELILTLAVQGKLVPQDPSDEPASGLLKKIRAEKDRLIAEGKIKKDKPLAEITEEEKPFELPLGWEWERLGFLAKKLTDGSHNPPANSYSGYPMLSSQNVKDGGIIDFENPSRYLSEEDFKSEDIRTKIEPDDVLLTIVASLGRAAVVPEKSPKFALQRSVAVINTGISPWFLSMFLGSPVGRAYFDKHAKGTAQKGIYLGKLAELPISVPPLAEQSRIVARVEALMRLCDALEEKGRLEHSQHQQLLQAMLDSLTQTTDARDLARHWQRLAQHFDLLIDRPEAVDALEQTILQLAVRGLLVPQDPSDEPASELLQKIRAEKEKLIAEGKIKKDKPLPAIGDDENPFELPEGWEWARLGTLANFIDYRGKTPEKTESGIPLITAKNVRKGYINREPREFISESAYDDWMTRGFPVIGDLLFTTEAPLGNVAVIDIDERFALAQRVICFSIFDRNMSGLLLNFLQSPWFQGVLESQASGVTAQGIKSSRLQQLPIPIPPLAEQSRIVARVTELRAMCQQLRGKLSQARTTQTQLAQAWVEQVAV